MNNIYKDLIYLLYEKTQRKAIHWQQTSDNTKFLTVIEPFFVSIEYNENPFDSSDSDVQITIENNLGEIIENVTGSDIDIMKGSKLLSDFYILAKRQALGIDEALNHIIQALSNDKNEITGIRSKLDREYDEIQDEDIPF